MKIADINVELVDYCGSDLSIVNAARVSFHKISEFEHTQQEEFFGSDGRSLGFSYKKELGIKDKKLITYLAKHKHFSPFNHAFITMRVKAPIFVARQLVKHKFMPWNEVSRRYVDDEPEFYIPLVRSRSENVKQGSGNLHEHHDILSDSISIVCQRALSSYNDLLESGVAPEIARAVLPQNMQTEWWWSGTLGAYLDMLELRLDPHTQYESRTVAQQVAEIIKTLFPVSYAARLPQYV